MDSKSLLASKTFWSVAFGVGLKAAGLYMGTQFDPSVADSAANLTTSAILFGTSFLADVGALYGRVTATKRIGIRR